MVKPVNSSGGLLFLAILMTSLFAGGVALRPGPAIALDGTWEILGDDLVD